MTTINNQSVIVDTTGSASALPLLIPFGRTCWEKSI